MHAQHAEFIAAIHAKQKIQLLFFSEEDGMNIQRTCAPMDHAVGTRIKDGIARYWFWDYDSDKKSHTLGLLHQRIDSIILLDQYFDPGEFVTWKTNWSVPRNWGTWS